jgi:hypothetical protein
MNVAIVCCACRDEVFIQKALLSHGANNTGARHPTFHDHDTTITAQQCSAPKPVCADQGRAAKTVTFYGGTATHCNALIAAELKLQDSMGGSLHTDLVSIATVFAPRALDDAQISHAGMGLDDMPSGCLLPIVKYATSLGLRRQLPQLRQQLAPIARNSPLERRQSHKFPAS